MVIANDPRLLESMRRLRDSALDSVVEARLASPMTDLQASLGLSQLARYDDFLSRRRQLADLYFDELRSCSVELPETIRSESIFYRFPVCSRGPFESERERFGALGVQVRQGVDRLLHRLMGIDAELFPVAERLFHQTVSIPLYPALTDEEAWKVIETCRRVWET